MNRAKVMHVASVEYTARALLVPQMQALRSRGYDVRLACAPDGAEFGEDLAEFSPMPLRFPRSPRPAEILRSLERLRGLLARERPDILHLHTPAVALPARLLPSWAIPARTRVVYTVHGFAHVWDDASVRHVLLERVERGLASRTDALLFQSREDLEQVRHRGYRTRTLYLGNGVQDEWFSGPVDRSHGRPARALFVGRLVQEKGVLDLLEALEGIPELTLAVVGSQLPTERDGVGDEVARRATSGALRGRVELLGSLPSQEVRAQMERSDFLVLPSYREGVPRSIIEGMARGRPAVVTDVRGCRELVTHGENGLIVPAGRPAALGRALGEMIRLGAKEYRGMSESAYALVSSSCRESQVIGRLVDAYTQLGVAPVDRREPGGVGGDDEAPAGLPRRP